MLRSLFTTALRRLFRHRGFALTNIAGLVVGLAAAFLLGLFVEHELSYDEFHDDVGDIYRVIEHPPDGGSPVALTRMPVLPALEQEMPEIAAGTRMRNYDRAWLGGPEGQMEIAPLYVDSTFFDVFSFEVLRGNAREAVSTPGAIALTASVAETLFGDANPVGETLPVNFGSSSYRVAAVVADPPANSSIDFEALASRQNVPGEALETIGSWYNTNTPTYVRLEDGADRSALEEKLPAFSERRLRAHPDGKSTLGLRPLEQEHAAATNSRQLIGLLSALAIAILLIAGINTTNLTTARGLGRVGELGMRQALGARRPGLVLQFFLESLVTCAVAAGLALLVVGAVLPSFNNLLNLSLSIDGPRHLPAAAAITLFLGIAIGAYPALYLTRGSIANALRGRFEHSRSGQRLRSGLVVAQFALSAVLVVGSVGVWQQVQHMKAVDPGVD
jgi:putative ABC transport system permease protein